jgi:hypothetical protein
MQIRALVGFNTYTMTDTMGKERAVSGVCDDLAGCDIYRCGACAGVKSVEG